MCEGLALDVMYWFVLICSLSLFGLGIRSHLAPPPIVFLRCPTFCSLCSLNRVLVLCSGLCADFLVVSAIAIIIVAFVAYSCKCYYLLH